LIHFIKIVTVFILFLYNKNSYPKNTKEQYETLRLIRQEKFNHILPDAMRDAGVDMWIHSVQGGIRDPLALDIGGQISFGVEDSLGYYIFTDRGGDRIERAILGGYGDESIYDYFGSEKELFEFVKIRNPNVIAVNMSLALPIANGLSHIAYLRMTDALGEKYTKRIISAENVITNFRVRRVQKEIIVFANICEIQRQVMESSLLNISPRITTRGEIGWSANDKLAIKGFPPSFEAESLFLPYMPRIVHSEVSDNIEINNIDYRFQPGDFLSWDMGVGYLNFGTDFKRAAYVLKDDEKNEPVGLKRAWLKGLNAREIIRKNFQIDFNADESLKNIVHALEKEGYIYTPSMDVGTQYRDLINKLGDSDEIGFTIDMHATGNTSIGDVTAGPSVAPWRFGRSHIRVDENYIFALEFVINSWIPEWSKRISISYEENAIVTGRGVEYIYPPQEKIILISGK
jgi:hypothetical protein